MRVAIAMAMVCALATSAWAQPPRWHRQYDYLKHDWPRAPRYDNPLGAFLGGIIGGFLAKKLDDTDEDYQDEEDQDAKPRR